MQPPTASQITAQALSSGYPPQSPGLGLCLPGVSCRGDGPGA
eukprot:CAMPEP_0197686280 /NCGR_PEP_ID=MMETSP1338-20131121/102253_1 /TAXON_ID=43686 ORGANISM="Pelagodinium beii, Strain RCC1491" /NCGR_SAMPLE_ID=MMETSP1338 /ASSEMBLY_ACC=CAM_ASM_000754 /LENGTH=41 /DNA_ID= /DNA_START= /DNA_END= /DNA_ORIENTATION=